MKTSVISSLLAWTARRRFLWALSEGDFLLCLADAVPDGLSPAQIERCKIQLNSGWKSRRRLAVAVFAEQLEACAHRQNQPGRETRSFTIMGERNGRTVTPEEWAFEERRLGMNRISPLSSQRSPFTHSGDVIVTAITSMYRAGQYIERFLDNISQQTLFDRAEIIILDANSPDGEFEVIRKYQRWYPNIIYKRFPERISVYEAWNAGIKLSRGPLLTSANVDDVRRSDSFQIQSSMLLENESCDLVYQDFFYTMNPNLSYEDAREFGFKSKLPIVTKNNILQLNSFHNAPMWRKKLHAELGLFDVKYKSAADYEFWLRCVECGKKSIKINSPHVAYFQNPMGVSTRENSQGREEVNWILKKYRKALISNYITMSDRSFARAIGARMSRRSLRYDQVQGALIKLGRRQQSFYSKYEYSTENIPAVIVDGAVFQTECRDNGVYLDLLNALASLESTKLYILDRGNVPRIERARLLSFPTYHWRNTPADSLLIEEFCQSVSASVFFSTLYTTPTNTPSVFLEGPREVDSNEPSARAEKNLSLAHAFLSLAIPTSIPQASPARQSSPEKGFLDFVDGLRRAAGLKSVHQFIGFSERWRQLRHIQCEVDLDL